MATKANKTTKARKGKEAPPVRGGIFNRDVSEYERVKTPHGNVSFDCGDKIAKTLRGKDLNEVIVMASKATGRTQKELRDKYSHLNPGGQRMALGNILRAAARRGV
jgi:hypothetical protein